jgi:hypothetical protein
LEQGPAEEPALDWSRRFTLGCCNPSPPWRGSRGSGERRPRGGVGRGPRGGGGSGSRGGGGGRGSRASGRRGSDGEDREESRVGMCWKEEDAREIKETKHYVCKEWQCG